MSNWPGLPPIDLGSWGDFQRKRLQQAARERIASVGAVASDWGSQAQRRIDGLTSGIGEGVESIGEGISAGIGAAGAGWQADLDRIRQEAAASEAQFPSPAGDGMVNQTGAPQGEAITSALAETATRETPGGQFFTNVARNATQNTGPMTADTPVENVLGMAGLAAQNVGAPLPGGRTLPPGLLPEMAARAGVEALPGGQTSVLEGYEFPSHLTGTAGARYPNPLAGQRVTTDTPVLGGLTTPDEAIPFATGAALGEPDDIVRAGNRAIGAARSTPDWAQAALDRIAGFGAPPQEALGIVNARSFDPTGINPTQGRLAARGKPGRAPGPAMLGPVTEEEAAKLGRVGYGAEYAGSPLSAEPFPPGPGPDGEYDIPHPTLGTLKAAPPAPNTWLTSDGYIFWQRVTSGQTPYKADWEKTQAALQNPRYPWDPISSPPPKPGEPGYGRLPGIEEQPLPAPDWDTKLAGWAPKRGTDPATLRHLLNRYAEYERFPHEAVDDLAPSHPDLATPEARQAALDDMQDALVKSKARRSANEDRAIQSERNTRKTREAAEEDAADPDSAGDGVFSYTSTKGVGPDGEKEFHFSSSYEVASAIKFDQDPNVVSWQKGAGPRGRVRVAIDPKYGYNPTDPALMANSDPGPGSEVIYSPDFLLTMKDGSQRVVETKNAGIVHIPAWRIGAKSEAGQRHFEDKWGVGFMMMAEDQLGRPFLRDLAQADLSRLPADHPLRRIRPGDVADFQKKMSSAWRASRGGASDAQTLENAQHLADLNSSSKYPPPASLDESVNVQQYLSPARAQAEAHVAAPEDGWTFSVDEQGIPMGEGLGGFMVPITPDVRRITYPTHRVPAQRLAQFRHENADLFEAFPDARLTTRKGTDAKGTPTTTLEVTVRAPDGQAAAEVANLFRAPVVYTIDRSTAVPVRRRNWVEPGTFDRRGRRERLKKIADEAAARADRGAAVPDFRDYAGLPLPGVDPLAPAPARPPRGRGPGRAAAGRGAGVPGVPESGAGAADRPGAVAGAGGPEPDTGDGLPAPADPALAPDGRGSGGLGIARGAGAGRPAAGAAPGAAGDWRSALDAALASVQPYGAARTGGERAFDLAAGTAGGVAGAATADEDATWQERAGRFAMGATAASLAGPTARGGLGQLARSAGDRSVTDGADTLGIAAGRPGTGSTPSGGARSLGQRLGRVGVSDIPTIMASVPLMAPSSLGANLTGGALRSFQRVLGKALEGRPIEALVDAAEMAKTVPGALSRFKGNVARGPGTKAPGLAGGVVKDDLVTREGVLPTALTIGTRANAATDEFWREINAAGAGAAARRRGMGLIEAADYRNAAGDYATFGGSNTQVAKKLTELKSALHDPEASFLDKSIAWGVTSMAPYIMMPERLLKAALGTLAPVGEVAGAVKAFRRGDKNAGRELAGRAAVAIPAWITLAHLYNQGQLTGAPPEDANERRRLEAQGTQWDTIAGMPARYFGSFGQSASAFASVMDAAKKAEAEGADPGAVWEARGNELMRWVLEESYLSDLVGFGEDVGGGRGVQSLRRTAAGVPSRFVAPVAGVLNAADPYEREAEAFPEMVASRVGARSALRTRIDPTTGEDQRRRGSGWSRYWGERGSEQTPDAQELARRGLQPRTFGPAEEYAGSKQTQEQRRILQQAFGSETGRALRETTASKAYQQADEAGKEKLLSAALRQAAEEADIVAGERVGRDAKSKAQLEYQAVPRYDDLKGTPDEVRRLNARVRRAKSALAAAIKADPQRGEQTFRRERPADYKLADRGNADADDLREARERIEKKYGVELGG